jgi:hypothetical protein
VCLDGERAVVYHSRMNPFLGRNVEAMDRLEWLARLADHIPDPRQHRTLFLAACKARPVRRRCGSKRPLVPAAERRRGGLLRRARARVAGGVLTVSPKIGEALREQLGPIRFTPGFFQATAGLSVRF